MSCLDRTWHAVWVTQPTGNSTRVGWIVYRLTKKELCHSNETWHAFNSTFPDTNCIVSFQINPHLASNSGLWNVVQETFRERPGKLTKGVLFHQDNAPAPKSVVAMAAVRDCGSELVDRPPYSPDLGPTDYFLFPNMKEKNNTWLGSSIGPMMRSLSAFGDFFQGSGWELLYHRNRCNTNGRSVWTAGRLWFEK